MIFPAGMRHPEGQACVLNAHTWNATRHTGSMYLVNLNESSQPYEKSRVAEQLVHSSRIRLPDLDPGSITCGGGVLEKSLTLSVTGFPEMKHEDDNST